MEKHICKLYKGYYIGNMEESVADNLIELRKQKVIPSLKRCIYNLPKETIYEIINYGNNYNKQLILSEDKYIIGELQDYQTVGVAYSFLSKKFMLTDSVGLGKTVQMAGCINLCNIESEKTGGKPFRYIFLAEKSAVKEIQEKLIQFTGEFVLASTGETKDVDNIIDRFQDSAWCSIVGSHSLLNNTKFFRWLLLNKDIFDMIIIDESCIIKSDKKKSNVNSTYGTYLQVCSNFERVVLLNATPVENNLLDFYNQIRMFGKEYLPTKQDFKSEFMVYNFYNGMVANLKGYKNEDTFKSRIGLIRYGTTRKEQNAVFEDNEGKVYVSELSKLQKSYMPKTTMWRMVCDCPNYFDKALIFDKETVPKLVHLDEILEKHKGEQIMLYCYYKETQSYLKKYIENKGFTCEIVNGGVSLSRRTKLIKEFNAKLYDILITNIQKSIDLKSCNIIVFYSFDYNPQKMVQCEGRITREFNVIGKRVYVLVSKGREEDYLRKTITTRAKNSTNLIGRDYSCILDLLEANYIKEGKK